MARNGMYANTNQGYNQVNNQAQVWGPGIRVSRRRYAQPPGCPTCGTFAVVGQTFAYCIHCGRPICNCCGVRTWNGPACRYCAPR